MRHRPHPNRNRVTLDPVSRDDEPGHALRWPDRGRIASTFVAIARPGAYANGRRGEGARRMSPATRPAES